MKNKIQLIDFAIWNGFIIFAMSSVIIPVCLPEISNSIKVSYSEGGGLETFRNSIVFGILILSLIIAKFLSKKTFIALGQFLISFGLLIISFANDYFLLIIAISLMGIGGGLSEAFLNPFVVSIHTNNSAKYLNLSNAFYPIGVVVSAIIFGELLTAEISWRIIFRIAAIVCLGIAIFTSVQKFKEKTHSQNISASNYFEILKSYKFWLFAIAIFLGGGIESALTFWGSSFVNKYLSDIPRSGSIAVMIFAVSMFIGRFLTSYFTVKFSLLKIMLASSILGILVGILLPYASSLSEFYILVSFSGLATACLWPSVLAEASATLKFDTTILLILLACSGVIGFGITPLFMGVLGDISGLRTSFMLVPIFFVLLLIIFYFENKLLKN